MSCTALHEKLVSLGARFAAYGGAETAAVFSDPAAEWRALRTAAGVFDLGWRAKMILTGQDRVRWLNGMVTNNVRDLARDRGCYNFLLNAQGRILGDMLAWNLGDCVLVDTDTAQLPALLETFEKFIIMDDVEVTAAGQKLTAIGVRGPKAEAVLRAAGFEFPDLEPLQLHDTVRGQAGVSVVRGEFAETYEVWMSPSNAPGVWDGLVTAGAALVGTEALETQRILDGIPRYGQDIRQRDLPQETEQYRALNFSKGCYVGQEIVERIRSRGQVHRTFTGFIIEEGAPEPGAHLQAGGRDVAELTSVRAIPAFDSGEPVTVALGYARREAAAPGAILTAEGVRARVTPLPFTPEALAAGHAQHTHDRSS
jgi:folate-binding protein YgfZ